MNDPEIDVIYNPLPNSLHAEWTIKALRAGKHVLCEKPMALTLAELDAMAEPAQRKSGRVLAEAFMYRHHPQTLKAKELVADGSLGKLQLVKGSFTFMLTHEDDVRLDKELGGGSIWDLGCYPISYARTMIGAEPLEVFGWQVTGPTGIDMSFIGQMRFPNDVHAQFDCGFASPEHSFVEIVGTEGTLNIPFPFQPEKKRKRFILRTARRPTRLRSKARNFTSVKWKIWPMRFCWASHRASVWMIAASTPQRYWHCSNQHKAERLLPFELSLQINGRRKVQR